MADEKMFDLMTKIYSELQDTKSELQDTKKEMSNGFKDIKSEITVNRTAILKLETKLENDTTDKYVHSMITVLELMTSWITSTKRSIYFKSPLTT